MLAGIEGNLLIISSFDKDSLSPAQFQILFSPALNRVSASIDVRAYNAGTVI